MKAEKLEFGSATTIEEVLDRTEMNWIAEEQQLITGAGIDVPSHKALIRNDTQHVLGIVGKAYTPRQNPNAFAFMDTLCQQHEAKYEYVYMVDGGRQMIVQAKIDKNFNVRRGDEIATYITMMNSFDGSTPFKIFFTPIRLFCTNQLGSAMRNRAECISIRHTVNSEVKAEDAFRVLCTATQYFAQFKEKAKTLANKALDAAKAARFLKECFGDAETSKNVRTKNVHDEVMRLANTGSGNNGSSMWDMYNGVTEYIDHIRGKDAEKRLASALIGSGSGIKAKAWEVALKLSN